MYYPSQVDYLSRIVYIDFSSILLHKLWLVIPERRRMASLEEVISSKDPAAIKKKRSAIQGMMTTIEKNIDKLLVKTDGQFQHEKIQRLRVEGEIATLRRGIRGTLNPFTRPSCSTEKRVRTQQRKRLL